MPNISKITLPDGVTYNLVATASDTKVTQTATTTNAHYEVLFSNSANDTTETAEARKTSGLLFNPSKKALTIGTRTLMTDADVGNYSVSIGYFNIARGIYAFVGGDESNSDGYASFTHGSYLIANHRTQFVFGEYNIADDSTANANSRGNYIEIIGNGTATDSRSNARTLDWSGNQWIAGSYKSDALTASKLLVSDANKKIVSSNLAESDLITTSNIGSQSVNYATSAGSATSATNATNATYATSAGSANDPNALHKSDWWTNGTSHNANDAVFGVNFAYNQTQQPNVPTTGTLITFTNNVNTNYRFQMSSTYGSNALFYRNRNGDNNTWTSWVRFLDTGNYQSYIKNTLNINTNAGYMIGSHSGLLDLGSAACVLCGDSGSFVRKYSNTNTANVIHASQFAVDSSKLIKENVKNITEEYAKNILKLRPVTFDYIEKVGGQKGQCGMIAEEVLDIFPECVNVPDGYTEEKAIEEIENGNNMMCLSIDYAKFTPYLIKMIQMQQQQINELKRRIEG